MSSTRIKAVTRYEALDGQLYETMDEAGKASSQHNARKKVATALQLLAPGTAVNSLVADIVSKPDLALKLREGINAALDYQRRYGKLRK